MSLSKVAKSRKTNLSSVSSLESLKDVVVHTSVGDIVSISESGEPQVCFPEVSQEAIAARCAVRITPSELVLPAKVVLLFENGDPTLPVITGFISSNIFASELGTDHELELSGLDSTRVHVDGKAITFDAQEEILLRCGKSSILLKQNGKVVIKGTQVLSRSSGANKIKGSSVNIN